MKKFFLMAAMFSSAAMADYQWELEAGLGHTEINSRSSFSSSIYREGYETWGLGGTYYLDSVTTQDVPLSDAGFLSQSSLVTLTITKQEVSEVDQVTANLQGTWVFSGGWFAGLSYDSVEQDSGSEDVTRTGPGVILGSYIGDSSAIRLHYQKTEYDYPDLGFGVDYDQSDREIYTLSYKNVVMVDGQAHTDIEIDLSKSNYAVELNSSIGWYVGTHFKYGAEVLLSDYDYDIDRQAFGLWLEYFVGQSFAVSANYRWLKGAEFDFNDSFRFEEESMFLTGKYRF